MLFRQGEHLLYVGGACNGLFDVLVGEELLTDDPAQAFGDLPLTFGEDAMKRKAQHLLRVTGMKKEFQRHPDGQPVYKSRYEGNCIKPPADVCHMYQFNKKAPRVYEELGVDDGVRTHDPQNHNLML